VKTAKPWYNEAGDQLEYQSADEAFVGEWINPYLTLYRSLEDNRIIGFAVGGVKGAIEESENYIVDPIKVAEAMDLLKELFNRHDNKPNNEIRSDNP
jgi:hypothetical protein